jgi:hypothetical protein
MTMTNWDWIAENNRCLAEYERQQEVMRIQRELLAEQRRANDIAERQAKHHGGVLGLLLVGLMVAGLVWAVTWLPGVIWRVAGRRKNSPSTPPDPSEQELVDTMRENNIDPAIVNRAIQETLRRTRRP